jgi:hypothetical protein
MSPKNRRPKKNKPKKPKPDKHELYQLSVQEPEADIEFLQETFQARYGRAPHLLREDFGGTAYLASTWVADNEENRAWAVDLDSEPLEWGAKHNAARLTDAQRDRLAFVEGNVLDPQDPPVDIIAAFNFSYFTFQTRRQMLQYFRQAHANLRDEGMFVLDLYGGPEAQQLIEESTEKDGFYYVWDQDEFDPIKGRMVCYIHFDLPGGKRMKKAFTYDWRLWTLPELCEILGDAGFAGSEVYWEGIDEDGDGDGVYTYQESAENTDSWIAYIVGYK